MTRSSDPRYRRLIIATRKAAKGGYDAVSMRDLAAATRMSLTTLYQFCPSKDVLIAEAHADRMTEFRDELARRPPLGATAEARVLYVVGGMIRALERDAVVTRTLLRAVYSLDTTTSENWTTIGHAFIEMIDQAIGDENVRNRAGVIDTLGHVIDSAMIQWVQRGRDAAYVKQVVETAVHVLLSPHPAASTASGGRPRAFKEASKRSAPRASGRS